MNFERSVIENMKKSQKEAFAIKKEDLDLLCKIL
jgi:hypothetical protein